MDWKQKFIQSLRYIYLRHTMILISPPNSISVNFAPPSHDRENILPPSKFKSDSVTWICLFFSVCLISFLLATNKLKQHTCICLLLN